jgi:hypothetical protein
MRPPIWGTSVAVHTLNVSGAERRTRTRWPILYLDVLKVAKDSVCRAGYNEAELSIEFIG